MQRQLNFLRSIAPRRENVRYPNAPLVVNSEPLPSYESQFGNLPSYSQSQMQRLDELEQQEMLRRRREGKPMNRRDIEQTALSQFTNQMSIIERQIQRTPVIFLSNRSGIGMTDPGSGNSSVFEFAN